MNISTAQRANRSMLYQLLRRWWQRNPVLTTLFASMVFTSLLGLLGFALDPRLVNGAPTWAKTTKFAISVAFYASTLLWLSGYVSRHARLFNGIMTGIGVLLYMEMTLIIVQGARARMMHFNFATPLEGTMYTVMAASITGLWLLNMGATVLLLRQRLADRPFAWGLRLGLLLAVVGMGLGFLMTQPTAAQMAAMEAGVPGAGDVIGAHTVGAPDGGPGLPLLGWSTTHGDLRIPHFIGLHALQLLPLLGWFLSRRRVAWLSEKRRTSLVALGGGAYLGLMLFTTWQALRAQSILQLDSLTIGVALVLTLSTALAAVAIAGRPLRRISLAAREA